MVNWKESFLEELRTIEARQLVKMHRAFIYWYIKATENLEDTAIMDSIMDRSGDGGSDAVLIDHDIKIIKVVQSKFTENVGESPFDKDELAKFSKVGEYLKGLLDYQQLRDYVHAKLKNRLDTAIRLIKEGGYKPRLYFITTHRTNPNQDVFRGEIEVLSHADIERKFEEWRHGHTPELGELRLRYEALMRGPVSPRAFIANVSSDILRKEYLHYKEKLFSRNVRIFYGENKKPNRAMKATLEKQPDHFWYFNNGITILSEKIVVYEESKEIVLKNPQIINGCQTVSTIGEGKPSKALLFAKIVEVSDNIAHQHLIDGIIEANNRQNSVDERMLKANHPYQVKLQRDLEAFSYYYERKEGQYKEESKKSKRVADLELIKNIELMRANVAVEKSSHNAHESENELFSTHFDTVFREAKSHLEYLIPYQLWTYVYWTGQNHRGQSRKSFHRLASYHVLKLVYEHCPDLRDNTRMRDISKAFAASKEYDDQSVRKLFDIAYDIYGHSEYIETNSGQRDFFKSKETHSKIMGKVPAYVTRALKALFADF